MTPPPPPTAGEEGTKERRNEGRKDGEMERSPGEEEITMR